LASLKEHQSGHWTILDRDLMSSPLSDREIADFDFIILDPPRAGAYAQVHVIASSFTKPVIMISCDLATAARDAQEMIAGGYILSQCVLFDQFPFTAHLETMCLFERL
jgi:23S rRNA (uracil1939-C5)-methyltransferase